MSIRGNTILLIHVLEYFAAVSQCKSSVQAPKTVDKEYGGCHLHGTLSLGVTFNNTQSTLPQDFVKQQTYRLPEDASFHGACTPSFMEIQLRPRDEIYTISMVFRTKKQNHHQTWAVTNISLSFEGDNSTIHNAHIVHKRGGGPPSKNGSLLFQTPANRSYTCTSRQYIYLGPEKDRATVVFSQVRLQPFADMMKSRTKNGYICAEDYPPPHHAKHAGIIIPVILAVSLAVVLILLLIGYIIHKKIEGMGYANME